jgi:hypothetical protein
MQLTLNEIDSPNYGYLIQGRGMMNKRFIDETMANPLHKALNNGGKEGTKRKHPSLSQKNRTHRGSQRGTKTIMFQSLDFNRKKHTKKKKGRET